jgi:hypothetical protein
LANLSIVADPPSSVSSDIELDLPDSGNGGSLFDRSMGDQNVLSGLGS